MEFRVLGPFELVVRGTRTPVRGAELVILALLALNTGRPASYQELAHAVWGVRPPPTYRQQLHKHAHAIRKLLGPLLITEESGYRLDDDRVHIDLRTFDDVVRRAHQLKSANRPAEAVAAFRQALALWRGAALDGIESEALATVARRLDEDRVTVVEDCAETELSLGRHADVVRELASVLDAHPYRERLAGLLMLALHRCGRVAEVVDVYHCLRDRMACELGLVPSAWLRRLYDSFAGEEADQGRAQVLPAGLPKDLVHFAGRTEELTELDWVLQSARHHGHALTIAAVVGSAGVGKTALTLRWAHRVRSRFPDGQLYVDLRGFADASPLNPADALGTLLRALGVEGERIPADLDARVALYRSLLDGARVLLVLDNAAATAQLEPLLPGSASCFVVVTSRNKLNDLVALHDAGRVTLDVLSEPESMELLRRVLGEDRVLREPVAVRQLAARCGYLPLALRIAAAAVVERPGIAIAELVRLLASESDVGRDVHAGVRSAFDASYAAVSPEARELLRHLGIAPGRDIGRDAVAALAGRPVSDALRELERVHLVEQYVPGRYRLHDLIRGYARVCVERDGADPAAGIRLAAHYLGHVDGALEGLGGAARQLPRPQGVEQASFADQEAAAAWLRQEHTNLVDVIAWLGESGHDELCAHLVEAVRLYFYVNGGGSELVTAGRIGLAASERFGEPRIQIAAHSCIALGMHVLGDVDGLRGHYLAAIRLAEEIGRPTIAGYMRSNLGESLLCAADTREVEGHHRTALDIALAQQDPLLEVTVHVGLSTVHTFQGRLAEARCEAETSIRQMRDVEHATAYTKAYAHGGLAWALLESGELEPALAEFDAALALHDECGNRVGGSYERLHLGRLRLLTGQFELALDLLESAFAVVRDVGTADPNCAVRIWLAAAHLRGADRGPVLPLLDEAMIAARRSNNLWREAEAHLVLAEFHLAQEATTEAAAAAEHAFRLCRGYHWGLLEGWCHQVAARIHCANGRRRNALSRLERALETHRRTGQRLCEVEDLLLLNAITGRDSVAAARSLCADAAGRFAVDVWRTLNAS